MGTRVIRRLVPVFLLAAFAGSALAQDADGKLHFTNAQSESREIARRLLQEESGEAIRGPDVSIAEVDLNVDGYNEIFAYGHSSYFCGSAGCSPRIYGWFEAGWFNLLFDETGATIGGPDAFTIARERRDGYSDILYGDFRFGWNGESYVQVGAPPAGGLDTFGFMQNCTASPRLYQSFADAGVDPDTQGLCNCLVREVQSAGLQQHELDLFGKDLAQMTTDEDIQRYGDTYEDLLAATEGFKAACLAEAGIGGDGEGE